MLILDDVLALERLMMAAFSVFLFLVFYAVVLYFSASKVDTRFGEKIDLAVSEWEDQLAALSNRPPEDAKEPPSPLAEPKKDTIESPGNIEDAELLASRIKVFRALPGLIRESLLKSSLWLFLMAFSVAQTPVLMRYEFVYFSSQYSVLGIVAIVASFMLFTVNYSRYGFLRKKLNEASKETPSGAQPPSSQNSGSKAKENDMNTE